MMCLANNSSAFTLATILIIFFFPFLKSQSYSLFLLSPKKKVQILWSLFLQWPLYPLSNFICVSLFHLISLWHLSEPFSINWIFLHHVCSLFKGINVITAIFQICGIFKFDKTHSHLCTVQSTENADHIWLHMPGKQGNAQISKASLPRWGWRKRMHS